MLKRFFIIQAFVSVFITGYAQKQSFNQSWEFVKDIDTVFSQNLLAKNNIIKWERISLPHTASIEPIEKVAQHWQGICFYRKFFVVPVSYKGKHVAVQFDAAMQEADVYLNGQHIFNHQGGYLPFYIDISDKIKPGVENSIVVRLDNRDNRFIPPGKPLKTLDFNYYSGIYRNGWLITKDKLHISDPVAANKTAGGGVFIHYEDVSDKSAALIVKTEIQNDAAITNNAQVKIVLKDKSGKVIAQSLSKVETIDKDESKTVDQNISILNPKLWSPETPYLYQLSAELLQNGKVIDKEIIRTGIKIVKLEGGAFYLNGKKIKIRGTNRHQEYPYIGNALSDNAQYRDVWKMKEAGFNFVRSSHYPQSPAYLDACDELGLMVMDAIPGWQYAGNDSVFLKNSFQDIKDMIHRDRNHASIVLWEASLNESGMRREYMEKAHALVHEELAFPGIYSAGWRNMVFDVFLPARQHGKAPDYWKKYDKPMPLLIAEYGDWEYYAQNAGFNQTAYQDLKAEERSSRQLIGWGEKRLLQQALNYQEAHNDNLYGPDLGDANWLMFDYNRGYAMDIESSGIMDMVRLPKFAFYFYQSQVDPVLTNANPFNKPMLFIANYCQSGSDTAVRIFSNCDEVELFLNGKSLGRQKPDKDQFSTNLKHPPFTFHPRMFEAGSLTAVGYINNKKAAEHTRKTPGAAAKINIRIDYSGKELQTGQNDIVFIYADIVDNNGTVIYNANDKVEFKVTGDAEIVGENPRAAEAGTASILLNAGRKPGAIKITAVAGGLKSMEKIIYSK
ncbi:MAG: glycoside hydrolase family 2 TIM barrel-domain containing protein [Chitinophagaceae bacterium]